MAQEQITAALSKEQAYALVDAVMERDDLALAATAHENEDIAQWYFTAIAEEAIDEPTYVALAEAVLGFLPEFTINELDPETDWVTRSLQGLSPVTAGGFYVHGSHDEHSIPSGLIPIKIDAAQAFGTGHHETTTGCLEAIDIILKQKTIRKPIDIGTGTGILAIAVAKILPVQVIASDIDPIAVTITAENAEINGVSNYIQAIEAEGVAIEAITSNAPYDLIIANILAAPLISLAPEIGIIADKGCSIVLSGLLNTQADRVTEAYAAAGMHLVQHIIRKDWSTLILEK